MRVLGLGDELEVQPAIRTFMRMVSALWVVWAERSTLGTDIHRLNIDESPQ